MAPASTAPGGGPGEPPEGGGEPACQHERQRHSGRQRRNRRGLVEFRDRSMRTDEDILSVLNLPVLATVPVMQSAAERRRAFQRQLFLNFGLGGATAACLMFVAYSFLTIR